MKQLFPFSRASLWNGKAIRFPRPFPERKSWLGNNLSKLDPLSNTENMPAYSSKSVNILLLFTAGYCLSKNIQMCPPSPDRDRSR